MKKTGLLLLISFASFAQNQGKVLENKTVKSTIMAKEVKYSIYLPADYDVSQRKYPVVYLLHGYTQNETGWVQFGNVNRAADELIAKGEIGPAIIVMPDGGISFYINDAEGKTKWMDFFHKEFIPTIEKEYRARGTAEFRAISGFSMGGYGSIINSLKYPNTFSACAALSPSVLSDNDLKNLSKSSWAYFWKIFGSTAEAEGENRLTKHWHDNAIYDWVKSTPLDTLKKVRWYLDCGDDDFVSKETINLYLAFKEKNLPHEFRIRDGAHDYDNWRVSIYDALKFISKGFDKR